MRQPPTSASKILIILPPTTQYNQHPLHQTPPPASQRVRQHLHQKLAAVIGRGRQTLHILAQQVQHRLHYAISAVNAGGAQTMIERHRQGRVKQIQKHHIVHKGLAATVAAEEKGLRSLVDGDIHTKNSRLEGLVDVGLAVG